MLAQAKFNRTKKIVNLIKESQELIIDKNKNFIVDGTTTVIKVTILIHNLQQSVEIWPSNPLCFATLEALKQEDMVTNSKAENVFRKRNQRVANKRNKRQLFHLKESGRKEPASYSQWSLQMPGFETSSEHRTQQEEQNG